MPEQYPATSPDQLLPQDDLLSMSGLEFMQGVRDGLIAGPPIAGTFNYRILSVDPGRVVFHGSPLFNAFNPMGATHGGWYGTLLDSCMACAVMTTVPKGSVYTTLEYKVNITRPIPMGMQIHAIGEIQHAGRSTGVARGEIVGAEDGKVYATGSTTCIIMKLR